MLSGEIITRKTQKKQTRQARGDRPAPAVVSQEANRRFAELASRMGLDAGDKWVGDYVDYEWRHSRWFLDGEFVDLAGKQVLEFGCNLGATAIVLAHLGALVAGVDVSERTVRLAEANVARFGCEKKVQLHCIEDTSSLPWPDGCFDAIVCNSVLEYIPRKARPGVLHELDRVLRAGGVMFILGTSNRLWLREVHSGRFLVNYIPDWMDRLVVRKTKGIQKGMSPFEIFHGIIGYENLCLSDHGRSYLTAKRNAGTGPMKIFLLRMANSLAGMFGWTVGLLTPSINVVLRKP